MKNDRHEMYWAPLIKLPKIRQLYLNDVAGLHDEDLIQEIGIGLLLRSQSIMEFTEATEGQVLCKRCALSGRTTVLTRLTMKPDEILRCPQCSWQIRWRVYLAETNKTRGQLMAGHARAAFVEYLKTYPQCHTYQEKMLAIDRLIHEFHWELSHDGNSRVPTRIACANLLDGTSTEVLAILDGLAYDDNSTPELRDLHDSWRAQGPIRRALGDK
jgi:hypothetical protein